MMSKALTHRIVEAAALLYGSSTSPMLVYAPDLTLLYANAAYERMTGRSAGDILGRHMFDAFPPGPGGDGANAKAVIADTVAQMQASDTPVIVPELQHDLSNDEGEFEDRFWSVVQWPVRGDGGLAAIIQQSEDITEKVRQRRLTDMVRKSAEAVSDLSFFSYDPDTDRFDRGAGVDAMFGFAADEAGPVAAPFFDRIVPEDLPAVYAELDRAFGLGPGTSASYDYRVAVPGSARLRYVRVRAGIARDPADGRIKLFGAFVDMTDIEEARARMQELSDRNAALVVESNHRIKNSLAIASAMLCCPMDASEDPAVKQALRAAATRIMAISDVHGELFGDTGVEWVDAGRLLERFVPSFARTVDGEGGSCRMTVRAQRTPLPSRYAVTMALMLNELLTNAVKYGMNSSGGCDVSVELCSGIESARLVVENAVRGRQFAQIISEGVGSELVQAFAAQLGGTITAGETAGTFRVEFTFPIPDEHEIAREADPHTAR
jgi:two-component sensor histidine kinase/PAS domain-containing protein